MNKRILVKRYAQGFCRSLKDESEFRSHLRELVRFDEILTAQSRLREILLSHFIPTGKKKALALEFLERFSFLPKNRRFVLLLLENGRFELLPDILDYVPELWNEFNGIATFEVSSVISLTETQKKRLEEKLSQLEGRSVSLKFKEDPLLVGGLSVRRGNIIYDASIKGHLERLKEKIIEG